MRPASPNAQQVTSFEAQQRLLAQRDEAERIRQQQLAAQMAQLQQEQAVPGPESPNAAPMTAAQRQAIYGDSPYAPRNDLERIASSKPKPSNDSSPARSSIKTRSTVTP